MTIFYIYLSLPILAILIISILNDKQKNIIPIITSILSGSMLLLTLLLFRENILNTIFNLTGSGILNLSFQIDILALIMSLFACLLWLFSSIYSIKYFKDDTTGKIKRYNIFSIINLFVIILIFYASNMFTLFIFFELLLVASYVLIIHNQTTESFAAGIKYLFFQIIGGLLLLFALILTYYIAGSTSFIAGGYAQIANNSLFSLLFWCYIVGFSIKAGLFPLHIWLPEAHPVAPSPASALLSGMVIKTGTFGIMRLFLGILGVSNLYGKIDITILIFLALFTMFWGSAVAIGQTHLKRVLAYSSVSQIGYIIMGISLLSPLGMLGALIHTLGHSIVKSLLFLSAGSIIKDNEETDIRKLDGYGSRNPIIFAGFTIGALSMIGFPLFVNFITKWTLGVSVFESYKMGIIPIWISITALITLLISSILNAIYYAPIVIRGWFYEKEKKQIFKIRWTEAIPIIILLLLVIYFGIFPNGIIKTSIDALKSLFPLTQYPKPF